MSAVGWLGIVVLMAFATVGLGTILALMDRRPPDDLVRPRPQLPPPTAVERVEVVLDQGADGVFRSRPT